MKSTWCVLLALLFPVVSQADISVTNKTSGRIEVRVANGSKTEVKSGEKVIFNTRSGDLKVEVFSGSSEKASSIVRDKSKLLVRYSEGVWSIIPE